MQPWPQRINVASLLYLILLIHPTLAFGQGSDDLTSTHMVGARVHGSILGYGVSIIYEQEKGTKGYQLIAQIYSAKEEQQEFCVFQDASASNSYGVAKFINPRDMRRRYDAELYKRNIGNLKWLRLFYTKDKVTYLRLGAGYALNMWRTVVDTQPFITSFNGSIFNFPRCGEDVEFDLFDLEHFLSKINKPSPTLKPSLGERERGLVNALEGVIGFGIRAPITSNLSINLELDFVIQQPLHPVKLLIANPQSEDYIPYHYEIRPITRFFPEGSIGCSWRL